MWIEIQNEVREDLTLPLFFAADGVASSRLTMFAANEQRTLRCRNEISELYANLRPNLFAYLNTLGLNTEEAEDIIQEAFLKLVRHLTERVDRADLRRWIFRVAHNAAMDLFRSGRTFALDEDSEQAEAMRQVADTATTPEEAALRQEQMRIIVRAMVRLTPQQRYAVMLRTEGLYYREIAKVLGVSTQRVAELVQRGLALLAGTL
jgi:RNA polymerase sigma-70 factor, ECF subfamily